jgi:DNA polymerase-3 subunit epsilon
MGAPKFVTMAAVDASGTWAGPSAGAFSGDAEALAQVLAHHPDYRVLRRLVPTLHFQREPLGPVRTLLVLDTETTGLEAAKEKVIELALLRVAVDTATGLPVGPVQVYDGLEDPGRPIPATITEITGITDAMVRGQRLDEARVAELMQGVDLVVAHNAGFDRPFVEARLPGFAHLAWACSFADMDWKKLGQSSAKLENLALACGWFYDAHRAETDCHALLAVLAQPLARFGHPAHSHAANPSADAPEGGQGESADTGLATLLQAATQTQHRLQATGAPFEAKDVLKARGYRWDAQQRVWGTTLRSEAALADELAWLADAVYGGQATRVRVEALDAFQRFSVRGGTSGMRLVAPSGSAAGF